jgi:hypothetical protein
VDRQTDRHEEANSHFLQFCKHAQNCINFVYRGQDVFNHVIQKYYQSRWPHILRHTSTAACLLRMRFWIPLGAWMYFCFECCALSGRGLCNELNTHPEESCWLWCIIVCDLETSRMRRPWPMLGHSGTSQKNIYIYIYIYINTVSNILWNCGGMDVVNYINNRVYVRWILGTPMTLASLQDEEIGKP